MARGRREPRRGPWRRRCDAGVGRVRYGDCWPFAPFWAIRG